MSICCLTTPRYDIAESFFNSVYCRIFEHRNINRDKLFVHSSQEGRIPTYPTSLTRTYNTGSGLTSVLERMLDDMPFTLSWEDKHRDIDLIVQRLQNDLGSALGNTPGHRNDPRALLPQQGSLPDWTD